MKNIAFMLIASVWLLLAVYASKSNIGLGISGVKKPKTKQQVQGVNHTYQLPSYATTAPPFLPLPVLGGQFGFLGLAPDLVPYPTVDGTVLRRNIATPGRGYCGWAGLSYGLYGSAHQTVALRNTVRQFIMARTQEELEDLVYQVTNRDPEAQPLLDQEIEDLLRLPETLAAGPGMHTDVDQGAEHGFLADLTETGAALAALALNRPIHIYRLNVNGTAGEVRFIANNGLQGTPLYLHHQPGHFEGLIGPDHVHAAGIAAAETAQAAYTALAAAAAATAQANAVPIPAQPAPNVLVPVKSSDLEGLEAALLPFWELKNTLDTILPASKLQDLPPCPEGKLIVKILRYSNCQWWKPEYWQQFIEQERQRVLNWVRTFDQGVQLNQIVVIVIQRSTLENLANVFQDGKCEVALPATSRPSYLQTLREQNQIRMLVLSSADGFLSAQPTLQRFLLGRFSSKSEKCIPQFRIAVQSHVKGRAQLEMDASEVLKGMEGKEVDQNTSALLENMNLARVKRFLNSLNTRTASTSRNSLPSNHQLLFSEAEAESMATRLMQLLNIHPIQPLSASEIEQLPVPDAPAEGVSLPYFRLHRYSVWNHQWDHAGTPATAIDFLERSTASAEAELGVRDWQTFAIGLSGLESPEALTSAFAPSNFPAGAAANFARALQTGQLAGISLPTADTLLEGVGELQRLLLGQFGGQAGVRQDYEIHVSASETSPAFVTSSTQLVLALSDPSAVVDPNLRHFLHTMTEARISRWALMLASRVGGAGGRNTVSRLTPLAPQNAFDSRLRDNGRRYFVCKVKSSCQQETKTPWARDAHYHCCANTRLFKCLVEGCTGKVKAFNEPGALERHDKQVHKKIMLKCDWCSEDLPSRNRLTIHEQKHHPKEREDRIAKKAAEKGAQTGKKSAKGKKEKSEEGKEKKKKEKSGKEK